jgi:hypothetical protein
MEACFDSHKLQDVHTCLTNTRVALLEEVYQWARRPDSQPVFWIQGVAGTGKTTIAKTIADTLHKEGLLGGSFFFSRQGGERRNAGKLFGTLAYQLAARAFPPQHPMGRFRLLLHETIKSNPDVFSKAYREQWEQLIQNPLLQLDQGNPFPRCPPILFVIDAVDECEPITDVGLILELVINAARLKTIQLRFFLTGRPEMSVRYGFRRIRHNVEQIILHQIESCVVDADIRTFVEHEFAIIQDLHSCPRWHTHDQLDAVVSRSAGLFIYAATLSRFLKQSPYPNQALTQFLAREAQSMSQLNQMYTVILDQSAPEPFDEEIDNTARDYYQLIIGSLAVLFDTVSIISLHRLLAGSSSAHPPVSPVEIEATLARLGSVIDIPHIGDLPDRNTPVRIFHPSFREFLLDQQQPSLQRLQLDTYTIHEHILNGCLNVMGRSLRKNLCQLSAPDSDPRTLSREIIDYHIPLDVQYACRYWIAHAQKLSARGLRETLADTGPVKRFLENNSVYWIEAMSLLGQVPQAVVSMAALMSLTNVSSQPFSIPTYS